MTRVVRVDPDSPDPLIIAEAAAILRSGGLVAFATETVYGLGADATNPSAVAKIFEAKGRPSTNPLILHVEGVARARECVADWPIRAQILADRFWPGPLTLVLHRTSIIPDIVTAGQGTVGVRMPDSILARRLIEAAGRPIAAPSANRSTGISPTEAEHVFKDLDGKIPLILDGGGTRIGLESTVLDLTGLVPRVLRPGAITTDQLARFLGEPVAVGSETTGVARSPGQMAIHYAPRTPTYRCERCPTIDGRSIAVLALGPAHAAPLASNRFARLSTPEDAARFLYRLLHDWDSSGLEAILILMPPDDPAWEAVRDRVERASREWSGHQGPGGPGARG